LVIARSRLPDPHQPAPIRAILSGAGHSSRPFLARDVPDPSFPDSAAWPGDSGSSLLPSGGAHGVVTLRRFAPDPQVDARVRVWFPSIPASLWPPRLRSANHQDATIIGIPTDPAAERTRASDSPSDLPSIQLRQLDLQFGRRLLEPLRPSAADALSIARRPLRPVRHSLERSRRSASASISARPGPRAC